MTTRILVVGQLKPRVVVMEKVGLDHRSDLVRFALETGLLKET